MKAPTVEDDYDDEMVAKILKAAEAESIPVPSDKKGYFKWLKDVSDDE